MSNTDVQSLAWENPDSIWRGVMRADHMAWRDVQEMESVQRAQTETASYGPLAREAFLGLYADTPGLTDAPLDPLRVVHQLFSRAEELPEWQGLRDSVDDDPVAAAFGAAHFAFDLIHRLPEAVKEALEENAQAAAAHSRAEEQLQQLEALLEGMQRSPNRRALEEQLAELQQQVTGAKTKSQQSAEATEKALDAAGARTTRALAQALAGAEGELADLKQAARAFGAGWGTGSGAPSKAQIDALEQLAAFLRQSPMLRQILMELGWAKRVLAEQVRLSAQGRDSFTHYQVGELQPEDLAGEEWVGLLLNDTASPLSLDFQARAFDGDLIHRRYEGEAPAGRGPIVFLRDTSGSMCAPPVKNAVAAAVELALMQWAMQEQRRFIAIPFSGPGQFTVYDPGPAPDLSELLDHLVYGYWSGTEPYAPLSEAIRLIQSDPSLKQGDLLILTDGAFGPPPEEFREVQAAARNAPGLRVVAVVVGREAGLADFADRVVLIHDLIRDRDRDRLAQAIGALVQP